MAMEGMEDREATFLEGLEDQETAASAMAMVVMGRMEAAMVAMGMVLVALEVVVEAEARRAPHLLVAGRPMRTGTDGRISVCLALSTSRARFSMRKLLRVLNISTPAHQEEQYGARKCETT